MARQVNTQQHTMLPYIQVIGAGAITGMRSMATLPIMRMVTNQQDSAEQSGSTLQHLLASPQSLVAAHAISVGEMISDKLPFMPDRTDPLPLLGRGLLGAMAGAAIFQAHRKPLIAGALLSGTSAILSTYASYHMRRIASEKAHVPTYITGFIEDVAMVGLRKVLFSFPS